MTGTRGLLGGSTAGSEGEPASSAGRSGSQCSASSFSSAQSSLFEQAARAEDHLAKRFVAYSAQVLEELHFRRFTFHSFRSQNFIMSTIWLVELLQLLLLHLGAPLIDQGNTSTVSFRMELFPSSIAVKAVASLFVAFLSVCCMYFVLSLMWTE